LLDSLLQERKNQLSHCQEGVITAFSVLVSEDKCSKSYHTHLDKIIVNMEQAV